LRLSSATTTTMEVFTWIGEAYYRVAAAIRGASNFYGLSMPSSVMLMETETWRLRLSTTGAGSKSGGRMARHTFPVTRASVSVAVAHSQVNSIPKVSICDLDRNGQFEVIAIGDEIRILDGQTGDPYLRMSNLQVASHFSIHGAAIGDFDNDARRDIAYVAV